MFRSFQEFERAAVPYLQLCDEFIEKHSLGERVVVDHICFKCKASDEYDQLRTMLENDPPSRYVYQVILAQRRVGYVGLREGIAIRHGSIACIELADKKPVLDDPGFHHVEIFPVDMSYQELIGEMMDAGEDVVLKKRAHHTTHDIKLPGGFLIRFTDKPLIKHIIERELSK